MAAKQALAGSSALEPQHSNLSAAPEALGWPPGDPALRQEPPPNWSAVLGDLSPLAIAVSVSSAACAQLHDAPPEALGKLSQLAVAESATSAVQTASNVPHAGARGLHSAALAAANVPVAVAEGLHSAALAEISHAAPVVCAGSKPGTAAGEQLQSPRSSKGSAGNPNPACSNTPDPACLELGIVAGEHLTGPLLPEGATVRVAHVKEEPDVSAIAERRGCTIGGGAEGADSARGSEGCAARAESPTPATLAGAGDLPGVRMGLKVGLGFLHAASRAPVGQSSGWDPQTLGERAGSDAAGLDSGLGSGLSFSGRPAVPGESLGSAAADPDPLAHSGFRGRLETLLADAGGFNRPPPSALKPTPRALAAAPFALRSDVQQSYKPAATHEALQAPGLDSAWRGHGGVSAAQSAATPRLAAWPARAADTPVLGAAGLGGHLPMWADTPAHGAGSGLGSLSGELPVWLATGDGGGGGVMRALPPALSLTPFRSLVAEIEAHLAAARLPPTPALGGSTNACPDPDPDQLWWTNELAAAAAADAEAAAEDVHGQAGARSVSVKSGVPVTADAATSTSPQGLNAPVSVTLGAAVAVGGVPAGDGAVRRLFAAATPAPAATQAAGRVPDPVRSPEQLSAFGPGGHGPSAGFDTGVAAGAADAERSAAPDRAAPELPAAAAGASSPRARAEPSGLPPAVPTRAHEQAHPADGAPCVAERGGGAHQPQQAGISPDPSLGSRTPGQAVTRTLRRKDRPSAAGAASCPVRLRPLVADQGTRSGLWSPARAPLRLPFAQLQLQSSGAAPRAARANPPGKPLLGSPPTGDAREGLGVGKAHAGASRTRAATESSLAAAEVVSPSAGRSLSARLAWLDLAGQGGSQGLGLASGVAGGAERQRRACQAGVSPESSGLGLGLAGNTAGDAESQGRARLATAASVATPTKAAQPEAEADSSPVPDPGPGLGAAPGATPEAARRARRTLPYPARPASAGPWAAREAPRPAEGNNPQPNPTLRPSAGAPRSAGKPKRKRALPGDDAEGPPSRPPPRALQLVKPLLPCYGCYLSGPVCQKERAARCRHPLSTQDTGGRVRS